MADTLIPRHATPLVADSLQAFPAVLVTGPRQVGKSTLAQLIRSDAWPATYLTLDDPLVLEACRVDPDGFLGAQGAPLILDEVQRAPDLMRAVKLIVDRDRRPGHFLLTGSASILTLKSISESLAGRVAVHELFPFSWAEMERRPSPARWLGELLDGDGSVTESERNVSPCSPAPYPEMIFQGGYPPAVAMRTPTLRRRWFESYRQTYLDRDVHDLADIEHEDAFDRLIALLAARTGSLLNQAALGREVGLPAMTLARYLRLLEETYQVLTLPAYSTNLGKRMVKAPKVFAMDTGLACALAGITTWSAAGQFSRQGALLESWVAGELTKALAIGDLGARLHFWRTHAGQEVDFVLELGERLVGIDVKMSQTVSLRDLSGLRAFRETFGDRVVACRVLYMGGDVRAVDRQTAVVPLDILQGRNRCA